MEKKEKKVDQSILAPMYHYPPPNIEEDEIDLLELWRTISSHYKLIIFFTSIVTILAIVISLLEPNIYKSKAVILPTKQGGSQGISSLSSQFGGLASMVGISLPVTGSSQDILAILKSRSLKAETIKKYNLLPVILYKEWDKKHNKWKETNPGIFSKIKSLFKSPAKKTPLQEQQLRMAKAIKTMSNMLNVSEDKNLGTIIISFEYPNPEIASKIVKDILKTLKNRMTQEAIRVAKERKTMLENELIKTSDPTIQQKLYALVAKQAETIAMAKVSEDFAFKVIDPPNVPVFKYKPKRKLIVIVAFITGLILSIFIVFFVEFIRNAKTKSNEKEGES